MLSRGHCNFERLGKGSEEWRKANVTPIFKNRHGQPHLQSLQKLWCKASWSTSQAHEEEDSDLEQSAWFLQRENHD